MNGLVRRKVRNGGKENPVLCGNEHTAKTVVDAQPADRERKVEVLHGHPEFP